MIKHVMIWIIATFGAVDSPDAHIYTVHGTSKGSGFFIEDGYVITAGHVVTGDQMIVYDGRNHLPAELVKIDQEIDLALFLTDNEGHDYYVIAESVGIGDPVYTIGSSTRAGLEFYRFEGSVLELSRWVRTTASNGEVGTEGYRMITDFFTPRGYSGAPLLNENDEVVGVIIAAYTDREESVAVRLEDLKDFLSDYPY